MTAFDTIILDRPAEGVARIMLNRPERGNGVVPEMARELMHALDDQEADRAVRCLILTGAPPHFCSGADLKAMKAYLETEMLVREEPFNARVLHPVTHRLASLGIPTIAAVNGAATAGGFDLALACDMRIAGRAARFGESYIKLGLAPGNGGSWFLPRLVGTGVAAELAFTGDLLDSGRALELGLVNRVVADDALGQEAVELATRIAKRPRKALEATKSLLRASWHSDLLGALNTSYWMTHSLQYSRDFAEGVSAAVEKRPPTYNSNGPDHDEL
jgi:enoyl-CoA hydratase/carnithine racemase